MIAMSTIKFTKQSKSESKKRFIFNLNFKSRKDYPNFISNIKKCSKALYRSNFLICDSYSYQMNKAT